MNVTKSFSDIIIHAFFLYLCSSNVQLLPQGEWNTKEFDVLEEYFKWSGNIINKECKNINNFNNNFNTEIIIKPNKNPHNFIINCISGLHDLQAYHITAVVMDNTTILLERKYHPLCAM